MTDDEEVTPATISTATPPLVLTDGNLALAYDAPLSVAPAAAYTTQNSNARLQFWIVVHVGVMAVDNVSVDGMDLTTLPSNVEIVEWKTGVGEIEYNDRPRLRENFTDVTPYCPLLQQFMTRLVGITLDQAKKIQIDLIGVLFESKRQAPYHHPVAAGDYSWDASDATMVTSMIPSIQSAISTINQINAQLGTVIPALNSAGSSLAASVNSNVVTGGNNLSSAINTNVVNPTNALRDEINSAIVTPERTIHDEFNANVVISDSNKCSTLVANLVPTLVAAGTFASPGVTSLTPIPNLSAACLAIYLATVVAAVGNYFNNVANTFTVSWPSIPNAAGSNQSWVPVGSTTAVNVTPTEQTAIMQGIATRTKNLTTAKNTKTNEVNALTTIGAVIAYDVTTGWPTA
jgi:hypothetical protein